MIKMTEIDALKTIKKMLDNFSDEYRQIVNTFDQSTMGAESMEEEEKMSIRMKALETRCKKSQFLLEDIITSLKVNGKNFIQMEKYQNQVSLLLTNIRDELGKNDLLKMIKYLEEIPAVMSGIDNEIKAQIDKIPGALH